MNTRYLKKLGRIWLCIVIFSFANTSIAQLPVNYSIRNGKMFIEINKKINHATLDSFMIHYNLTDIPLQELVQKNAIDTLIKLGWKIESNNSRSYIISKPLFIVNDINDPSQKIIIAQKQQPNSIFPENTGKITYGYNRFKNKNAFAVKGSSVTFFLRKNLDARKVFLAGTFNNWDPAITAMKRTDSGWIALVNLEPGKHWYKFVIDGNWHIDTDNPVSENDGRGNINSVYFKTNYTFTLDGFLNARKVILAGSFNDWHNNELMMARSVSGWQLPLFLAEGTHTYKFIADGKWLADPLNEDRLPDGVDGFNSVIRIGKPFLFTLNGYKNAAQVELVGSFNGWKRKELYMTRTSAGWELSYSPGPGNHEYKFVVDGKFITDPGNSSVTSNVAKDANSFLIIDPNHSFMLKGFNNAKNVFLAGDFNNWNEMSLPMKRDGDTWKIAVNLSPGKHLYKFIVDGKWIIDPGNELWEQNEHGTGNSVLWMENKQGNKE